MIERLDARDFEGVFRLMQLSFPEDEFRTREDQLALFDDPAYRVYALRGEGGVDAFCAAWALDERLFIEHLAVDPARRNGGLGGRFLDALTSESKQPVVLEVERPETEIARRRIGFYQRHGFFLNEYAYYQPPLRAGDGQLPLLVMSAPAPLSRDEFEKTRGEIYTRVYKCGVQR